MSILRSQLLVVEGHLNLALGNPEKVVNSMEENVRLGRDNGFYLYLSESFLLLGKARLTVGKVEQARAAFLEGKAEAERSGERTVLWRILGDLGNLEKTFGDETEAEEMISQAYTVIEYIADNAPPELRETFLAQPKVRAVVDGYSTSNHHLPNNLIG